MSSDVVPIFPTQLATKERRTPALFSPDAGTVWRVLEFFTANLRNPHTRKAYARAANEFAAWCESHCIGHLRDVQPAHVAAYIEQLQSRTAPSAKTHAALSRHQISGLRT